MQDVTSSTRQLDLGPRRRRPISPCLSSLGIVRRAREPASSSPSRRRVARPPSTRAPSVARAPALARARGCRATRPVLSVCPVQSSVPAAAMVGPTLLEQALLGAQPGSTNRPTLKVPSQKRLGSADGRAEVSLAHVDHLIAALAAELARRERSLRQQRPGARRRPRTRPHARRRASPDAGGQARRSHPRPVAPRHRPASALLGA